MGLKFFSIDYKCLKKAYSFEYAIHCLYIQRFYGLTFID